MFGIATNVLRRHWRTERRRLAALERTPTADAETTTDRRLDGVAARLDDETDARRVLDAVEELSPADRELLVLVAWEQMSRREVADVFGVPVGTVRSRLHRIRRELDAARRRPPGPAQADTNSDHEEDRP